MGKKRKNKVGYNIAETYMLENFYTQMLLSIYCTTYQWTGLPDSIDPRWLEMSLIKKGKVLFYEEYGDIGLVAFPAMQASNVNPYGYPKIWNTFGANDYRATVANKDGVWCYNNYVAYSDLQAIEIFARRLTYVESSVDTNILLQRFPGIVKCTEEQKLSIVNLLQDYTGGTPLMVVDKAMDLDSLEHIDFKVPYVADKLEMAKRDILADALDYIGIQYSSSNKQERLASTEIDSTIGYVAANRNAHLKPRKEAAERINKKWGLNVNVDMCEDVVNLDKIADTNPNNEQISKAMYNSSSGQRTVISNGELHNGA